MSKKQDVDVSEQHDVRRRIMKAAEDLFADKGFDGTSISDITEAAGVGRALIYYYFKDKRSLYFEVIEEGGSLLESCAEAATMFSGTSLEKIRHFIRLFKKVHMEHPNIPRMAMRAEHDNAKDFDKHARPHAEGVFIRLRKIIEGGVESGEFRNVDPERAVHMLMGMFHSIVIMKLHHGVECRSDDDVDFAVDFFAHGIVAQK
jgi:AcrR family transcriptional regulator